MIIKIPKKKILKYSYLEGQKKRLEEEIEKHEKKKAGGSKQPTFREPDQESYRSDDFEVRSPDPRMLPTRSRLFSQPNIPVRPKPQTRFSSLLAQGYNF